MSRPRRASTSTSDQSTGLHLAPTDHIVREDFVRLKNTDGDTFSFWGLSRFESELHLFAFALCFASNVRLSWRGSSASDSHDRLAPVTTTSTTNPGKLLGFLAGVDIEALGRKTLWCYHEAVSATSSFTRTLTKFNVLKLTYIRKDLPKLLIASGSFNLGSSLDHTTEELKHYPHLTRVFSQSDPNMIWDALLLLSVAWVCLRLYQLSQIPREVLEERLGYDIPPVPEFSIAGIASRSVLLYWLDSKDNGFASATLTVLVNGIKGKHSCIGDFGRGETSVEILNLRPDHCYNIKILATNNANLTTLSDPIRIQTSPDDTCKDDKSESFVSIAAKIRTAPSPLGKQSAQPSNKENAVPFQHAHKGFTRSRNAFAGSLVNQSTQESSQSSDSEEDESPGNIQRLTNKLEQLKRQKDDVDRQVEEEEAEAKSYHAELAFERDRLRNDLKEKEEASAELRRHGNQLDKLNRTAQSRRSTKEKLLNQKKTERQRMKDEVQRWDSEVIDMKRNIDEMDEELRSVNTSNEEEVAAIRGAIATDQSIIRLLEDEIRIRGSQIKDLEQQKNQMSTESVEEPDRSKLEKARDDAWDARYQAMQAQLQAMWHALQQSKMDEQQAEDHLSWWLQRRTRNPEQFAPIPVLDGTQSILRNRSRRARQTNSVASSMSNSTYLGATPTFGGAPPPYSAGLSLPQSKILAQASSASDQPGNSQAEIDALTGGPLMSPAANDLLPSNLFRDDDMPGRHAGQSESENNGLGQYMTHAVSNSDASFRDPNTPISASSRAGSVFASPHESMHNVSGFNQDTDPQPVDSGSSPANANLATQSPSQGSSRFSNLFSSPFGRQRGKSSAQEPPALGTLKQGQSQSFPRNLEQDPFENSGLRRRKGSYGTWANPVAGLLARNTSNPDENIIRARTGSGRSSRLNVFRPRLEGLDPTGVSEQERPSSRPSSVYSYDQTFGRPSSENQNIWAPFGDGLPNRSSPLNANWAPSQGPWSKGPSRRASVHRGSSTNLSIGSTPLEDDDIAGSAPKLRPEQAPIGTRPRSQRASTPKLNPAAPTFKTLFSRSEAKKAAKGDKASTSSRGKDSEKTDTEGNESIEEASPASHRLSKDAHSITTAASNADSHESFERTTSGTQLDPVPKESLMQKITRKSSSSKFNVPWSKDRSLFSKKGGEPSTPGEIDEDNQSEGMLGKSADSVASTPTTPREEKSGRAWPSMRRKSRKGLEAVEKESEAGDEEE